MKLPTKITPCPIIDVTLGIHFESSLPSGAVFGILYNEFKGKYPNYDELPILQIPEAIRNSDQNLKYHAHYKLSNETFTLLIGSNSLSISNPKDYVGWDSFFSEVLYVIDTVKKINIINSVSRLGLRYVDFFQDINILEKIQNKIIIENSVSTNLVSQIEAGDFIQTLRIINNVKLNRDNIEYNGSIIDIDTSLNEYNEDILNKFSETIEDAHKIEKKLFFNLLDEEFLKTLNPEYGGN